MNDGRKILFNLTALGNSVGSGPKGAESKIIELKSGKELEEKGSQLKNPIMFLNFRMDPTLINNFATYGENAGSRSREPSRAAKCGAIGALIRTLSVKLYEVPNIGVTIYNDFFPKIPAVAISTNEAEMLSNEIKKDNIKSAGFKIIAGFYLKRWATMWLWNKRL